MHPKYNEKNFVLIDLRIIRRSRHFAKLNEKKKKVYGEKNILTEE